MASVHVVTRLLGILVCLAILVGCQSSSETGERAGMNASEYTIGDVSTDVAQLEQRINLPVRPESVQWQIVALSDTRVPGPNRYSFNVVLRFSEVGMRELLGQATPLQKNSIFVPSQAVADWFPEALRGGLQPGTNGYHSIEAAAVYDGAIFTKPTSSLKNGLWMQVGNEPLVFLTFAVGD